MSSLQLINSKADILKKSAALNMNINAAKGLQEVIRSNVGPKGTLKMLVGGAGQVKITKDGNVLLQEMQIQHPTAAMIGRAATAQDNEVGDGTSSNVLFIGELMKAAERYIAEGTHPSVLVDGIESAKNEALNFLKTIKYIPAEFDREFLINVARTSLLTKVDPEIAYQLSEYVVDAVTTIKREDKIDLHMVEIMHMNHKMATETKLIKGIVMDHGARHPGMPKYLENCYILTCNASLEYEKTEVHSGFFYSNAEQREKLVAAERMFTDEQCRRIVEFKREVCKDGKNFVVINQKGIDPLSLDMLAKEGIFALRRAKKRNMERLVLACGGNAVNSLDDLTIADLGYAGKVYEQTLGEEKYTFVEGVENAFSCTILIKGPNDYTIAQVKEAVRDGLRSVKNVFDDKCVIPGAGAFEISCSEHLKEWAKEHVKGKEILGVNAFCEALLIIPKCISVNSGQDAQASLIDAVVKARELKRPIGVSINESKGVEPVQLGIFDNYCVKKMFLDIGPVLVQQLLMVDEVMRAGKQMRKG